MLCGTDIHSAAVLSRTDIFSSAAGFPELTYSALLQFFFPELIYCKFINVWEGLFGEFRDHL